MQIYEFDTYQDFIKKYVEQQKTIGNSVTYQFLAQEMRMQKSYFSKILASNASLNLDQAYLLAQSIKLNPEQKDYLYLLIEYEKATLPELKKELKEKILKVRHEKSQTNQYIKQDSIDFNSEEIQRYYLLAETQLIHIALSISRYQSSPQKLLFDLNISDSILQKSLKILEDLGLIEIGANKISLKKSGLHLPPSSPFYHQWSTQFKLKGIEKLKILEEQDKYNFTASFSGSDSEKEAIKLEFLKLLKKIEKIVKKGKNNHLYQIHFDLFKWL